MDERECNVCNPEHDWVIGCVHYNGGAITFRDYESGSYPDRYGFEPEQGEEPQKRYGVFGCASDDHAGPFFDGGETDDFNEALASFRQAEEWLLAVTQ
jgi:hypothetical protein